MHRWILPILVCSLFGSGCGKSGSATKIPPAPADSSSRESLIIAEVGGIQITGKDLRNYMTERGGPNSADRYLNNPDVLQIGLAAFVDQFVWAEMARRHGIVLNHEDAVKLASFEAQLLATRYVAEVLEKKAMPMADSVEAYYQAHQEDFLRPARVGVRHILVDSQEQAEQILGRAQGGADFAQLARQYSQDEHSRDLGGALGFVERGKPVLGIGKDPDFETAVLPLEPGQMAVVKSIVGWHVVLAERREGGGLVPLDEVRDRISEVLTSRDWSRVYNEDLASARKEVGARYLTQNFSRFSGVTDNPGRIMRMANQNMDPSARIELYRRLSSDFPDAKEAAEAQFMMGYLSLVEMNQKQDAKIAFERLREVFPKSPWRRAGDWMLQHLDDENPKELGSPRDVLAKAMK